MVGATLAYLAAQEDDRVASATFFTTQLDFSDAGELQAFVDEEVVDSIEEQRQVVIKGLQDSYGHVPGIAAATILGDGQIALILDPVDLMSKVAGRGRAAASPFELAG